MKPSNALTLIGVLAGSLLLSGCGDGGAPKEDSPDTDRPAEDISPAADAGSDSGPAAAIGGSLSLPSPGAPGWAEAQETYLEAFSGHSGVQRTESGVFYAVLEEGDGARPAPGERVSVHYEGRLVTGKVFDSSYKRGAPAEFATTQVIQGWQDVLPLMKEGGKWQVAIPAELAYGSREVGNGLIPPDSALVFTIELLQVEG